jgi:hypothetical protein
MPTADNLELELVVKAVYGKDKDVLRRHPLLIDQYEAVLEGGKWSHPTAEPTVWVLRELLHQSLIDFDVEFSR